MIFIPVPSSFNQINSVNDTLVYWIETKQESNDLAQYLTRKEIKRIALDQERAPYHKFYFQKPCLLQIADKNSIYFVDLLADLEITMPLKQFLEDPAVEKIFSDSPWDLYYFQEFLNIEIKGLKDIQTCSSLLNPTVGTTSLISLADTELGIDIQKSKKQQKSDWTKRPLSNLQIRYASEEIATFIPIYDSILRQIKENNLFDFFEYGNSRIPVELPTLDYSPENVKRIRGFNDLSNTEKRKMFDLGIFRDKLARKRNKPSFFVLTNNQLIELAKDKNSINSIISKKQKFSPREKESIIEIQNSKYPNEPLPSTIPHFSDYPLLKQKLLTWRYSASRTFRIPKRFIISKHEIDSFDEKVFENENSLLSALWFTSKNSNRCKMITRSFKDFLQSNKD